MSNLEEIKKALEGVTVQEWTFDGPANSIIIWCGEDTRVCFMTSDGPAKEHAKFITACNPASISELLSTLESLQRENERLRKFLFPYADSTDISGISWDGKYLIGDKASISAFHEMKNRGEQIDVYKQAYDQKEAVLKSRAEAAEAEVKRLRNKVSARALTDKQLADEIEAIDEACKGGFGEGGGSPGEWWYERADELEHERKRRELESQLHQHNSRTALASTGGEDHAE